MKFCSSLIEQQSCCQLKIQWFIDYFAVHLKPLRLYIVVRSQTLLPGFQLSLHLLPRYFHAVPGIRISQRINFRSSVDALIRLLLFEIAFEDKSKFLCLPPPGAWILLRHPVPMKGQIETGGVKVSMSVIRPA